MAPLYLLFESASGYCLFQHQGLDEVGSALAADQRSFTELERFSKARPASCPVLRSAACMLQLPKHRSPKQRRCLALMPTLHRW